VVAWVVDPSVVTAELRKRGFVYLQSRHADRRAAWATAREVFAAAARSEPIAVGRPELEIVGEFTLPPVGAPRRDFQALHIDFGVPIDGSEAVDVARFTALYIDPRHRSTTAFTRVVPLRALLGQRSWPGRGELLMRLRSGTPRVGSSHVEGILGRLVEAADGCSALPSKADPSFLCGMEFASLAGERDHFARHGLRLDSVERRIPLSAGELLLFDNLAIAHGRMGKRRPEELHQLCVGHRRLDVSGQRAVLDAVLAAFRDLDGS
jgi:hypothetical protein